MTDPAPLYALVAQWRKEADELDVATDSQWVEPSVKRACADELEAALAAPTALQNEEDHARVAPSVPCVAPTGSTAEQGQGVQSSHVRKRIEEIRQRASVVGHQAVPRARYLYDVNYLLALIPAAPTGTPFAVEMEHGTNQAVMGGTRRADDNSVSSSVRSHEYERLQQRADHEADGRRRVPDDGVVVEQGQGGRPREVSDVRAQTPTIEGNCLIALAAPTAGETPLDRFDLMKLQVRNRLPLALSDCEVILTEIQRLRAALAAVPPPRQDTRRRDIEIGNQMAEADEFMDDNDDPSRVETGATLRATGSAAKSATGDK